MPSMETTVQPENPTSSQYSGPHWLPQPASRNFNIEPWPVIDELTINPDISVKTERRHRQATMPANHRKANRSLFISFLFSVATAVVCFSWQILDVESVLMFLTGSMIGHSIGALEWLSNPSVIQTTESRNCE